MHEKTHIDVLLLANFIHQIINPLNSIAGTLDNIADGTTDASKVKQKANATRAQIELVANLVRNLAYLTQLLKEDGSASTLQKEEINIEEICIESTMFFQELARRANVAVEFKKSERISKFFGIENLLRQVVMNLLDNAVKYSDDNTKVYISAQETTDNSLIISISNYGCGFDHSEREKIFNLSERGEDARKKTSSGSGLGLYICRLIVENIFKGKINPEYNKKTRLTTFSVRIPK